MRQDADKLVSWQAMKTQRATRCSTWRKTWRPCTSRLETGSGVSRYVSVTVSPVALPLDMTREEFVCAVSLRHEP